jgi:sugar/nucleoside kinase (ribokinase family)
VCAGNWIVDIIHTIARWPNKGDLVRVVSQRIGLGGGAFNISTDLRVLGASFPLAAIGCVGDDTYGAMLREQCERRSIGHAELRTIANVATGHSQVMTLPGDSRTFFYHGGANDAFDADTVPIARFAAASFRFFYLGYLMLLEALDQLDADGSTGASRLLARARAAGLTTCVDFVSDARPDFARIVAPALPHCDYLIINEVEASLATGIVVRPGDNDGPDIAAIEAAAQRLLELGVVRAVIIHAPEAALWLARGAEPVWAPSEPVAADDIVSPVGAGDAFCACIIYGLHEDWPVPLTLRAAHLAAAACLGGATATDGIPPIDALLQTAAETPIGARVRSRR